MTIKLILSILFVCGMASAQYTRGFVYVAPGGASAAGSTERTYGVGAGAERLLDKGAGVGAEIGGLLPAHAFASNAAGILSLNGYYHVHRERALDPFITAGYSLLFRDFTADMFNFGGGANYWFQEKLGILVEFRDHVRGGASATLNGSGGSSKANFWNFRIGLTFR